MAINITELSAEVSDEVSGTTLVSTSATPTANGVNLIAILARNQDANADPGNPSSVAGRGMTWTQRGTILLDTRRRLFIYEGVGASPSAGSVTATFAGNVTGRVCDADGTGVDSANPVVTTNIKTGSGTGTSGSLTYDNAFGDAANASFAAFAHLANEATTPDGADSYTELSDIAGAGMSLATEWKIGDFDPGASWASNVGWCGIALEIKVAAAAASVAEQLVNGGLVNRGLVNAGRVN